MMTPRTILRDSALVLPVVVVIGGWAWGTPGAVATLASAVLSLVNLAAYAVITERFTRAVAGGNGAAMGVFFLVKTLAVLGAFAALLWAFDPLPVALGLGGVMFSFALHGMRAAWRTADLEDALARES